MASYAGNPLALKIVAQAISDLFDGELDRFLQEGELIFNGIRPVLRQQLLEALEALAAGAGAAGKLWPAIGGDGVSHR